MSNCHLTCFSRWRHNVHNRSAVWDGVGQQTAHDVVRFCDECCAVGYFVLLSLVQSHTLVLVQVWRKTRIVNAYFCVRETSRFYQHICVLLCKKIRMTNDHTAHWTMIQRLDIIERHSSRNVIAVSQGLNFKSRDPFALLLRTASSVSVNDDISHSYFHSPGFCRGTDHSSCLGRASSTTCSSDSRERNCGSQNENKVSQPASRNENKVFSLAVWERLTSLCVPCGLNMETFT